MKIFITNPKCGGELSKISPATLGRGGCIEANYHRGYDNFGKRTYITTIIKIK